MYCEKRLVEIKKQILINEIRTTLRIAKNKKDIKTLNEMHSAIKALKQDKFSDADISIKICQVRKVVNEIKENIMFFQNTNKQNFLATNLIKSFSEIIRNNTAHKK